MMDLIQIRAQAAIVACALISLIPSVVYSQPDTLWTRAIWDGGRPMEVIRTRDCGFAIGGGAWNGDPERRDRDFSLIKTDSLGFMEWRKFYTLDHDTLLQHENVVGIEQISDGGYILVGTGPGGPNMAIVWTDSTGELLWSRFYDYPILSPVDFALGDDGDNIVVVQATSVARKIDLEEGEIVWQRGYAVERSGRLWNVTNTTDGGFLLTGDISSIGEGSADMYAVKIDSEGEIEWRNTYGTEYYEVVCYAIQTIDGGYCMVGQSVRDRAHYGMIVRTDSEGEEIWRRIFRGGENEDIRLPTFGVAIETPDGGFALEGYTGWGGNAYLSRVNSEGELIWHTSYYIGGGTTDCYSLLLLDDFSYLLGGFSGVGDWLVRTEPDSLSEIAWDLQVSEEAHDFGEVTLDSTVTWELTLTNEAEYPVIIQSVATDSAAFSVEFDDVLTLEPDEETSIPVTFTPSDSCAYTGALTVHTYWRDIVIVLLGTGIPLSVPEKSNLPLEFVLHGAYPNPFNTNTSICYSLDKPDFVSLTVYDLQGRELAVLQEGNKDAGVHAVSWDASGLASGLYICRLQSNSKTATIKLAMVR